MKFPKRNKSNRYLLEQAEYSYNSGAVIDWGSNCDDWISIEDKNDSDNFIFLQGADASDFLEQMQAMERKYRSFDSYTCALVLAKRYIDCCWQ